MGRGSYGRASGGLGNRGTGEPGKTRLFHHWEGTNLTDSNWKPLGITMHADPGLGETPGGLQAPYVFQADGIFRMFYGDWVNICSATSKDGKTFERHFLPSGRPALFDEGAGRNPDDPEVIKSGGNNARDPMVIRIGKQWHCYYAAEPTLHCAVYCRTSDDLIHWSASRVVARGGQAGDGPVSAECPFVVELEPGQFYLFRTQHYGTNEQTSVYFSHDPMNFGVDHDEGHLVCTMPLAAPEIIYSGGHYFVAALLPSLKGIRIARLEWVVAP